MNKTKAALTGLALLAVTAFSGCATTEPKKQASNIGFEVYWVNSPKIDADSNEVNSKYPPLITIQIPNNGAYKNK